MTAIANLTPNEKAGYNRFLLLVSGLGGLLYGVDVGIIASALPYLEATSNLSAGQLSSVVGTRKGSWSNSIFGFGSSKWRLGGICRFLMHIAALMSPATPAAASMCPIFPFTEPTIQRSSLARPVPRAAASAPTSMGSPTGVPVPCASTY